MKAIKDLITLVACCLGVFSASAFGATGNAIEAVNVAQQGGSILLKIDLKEPLATPPVGFSISNPSRIAFDFMGTANGLGKNSQVLHEGDLTSMNVVQVGDRTRVVLNLVKNLNYATRVEGNSVLVTLSPIALEDRADVAATQFTRETLPTQKHGVRDISFRRGKDGEGRVTVDLTDAGTGIDIRQQGKDLIVEFMKTDLPVNLRRKMDVTDFATPVTSISTEDKGGNVRMVISPKGLWEHNAYQADNQFVVEVKPVIEDPNKLVQGSKIGYQGPRISINYQNGDVRALLRLMAEELGLNAVISETVGGTTTLVLKDVPADQVIDIIFQQKGLDMRKNGNVILIAPRDEIATREKLQYESLQQVESLEPLVTETLTLNYQKVMDVKKLLVGEGQGGGQQMQLISKRGSVLADQQSNKITIRDTANRIDDIRKYLALIDIPAKQVLIEARVVEADDSFNKNLGVRLGYRHGSAHQVNDSGVNVGQRPVTAGVGGGGAGSAGFNVNLPSYATSDTAGVFAFSLFNSSLTRILDVELAALEADGIGKIISSPKVVTANNVAAKIQDGAKIPYSVIENNTVNTKFVTAALALDVTPQITPDGKVRMKLEIKKEEPDWSRTVNGSPTIKGTEVTTDVVVDNGGTVIIGGIFKSENANSTEKVPFFGDIPYVGFLFKYNEKSRTHRELLVFITPKIINDFNIMR